MTLSKRGGYTGPIVNGRRAQLPDMPKLIIQVQGQESVVDLQTGSNTIGRQSTNSIPVKDSTLSRLHCEILLDGRTATLVDKGSRNGTLLNGRKVATQVLNPGDKISIGATLL